VRILFLILIIGEAGLAQLNPPPHLSSVGGSRSLNIGEVFLCPEIRHVLTPYPMFQDESQLDSITVIAQFIRKYPRYQFEVGVHTDSRGSDQGNLDLSEKRANAIFEKLTSNFDVSPHQLTYKGYGESRPLVQDSIIQAHKSDKVKYEQLHQMNRRTELRVIGYKHDEIDSLRSAYYTKTLKDSVFVTGDIIPFPFMSFSLSGGGRILDNHRDSLDLIAAFIKSHQRLIVEVQVHSDSRGSAKGNQEFTKRRGEYLLSEFCQRYGLCSERIRATGYGKENPIILNYLISPDQYTKDELERRHQINRRIDLKIIGHYQQEIDSLMRLRINKTLQDTLFEPGDRILCPEIRFKLAHWEVDSAYFSSIEVVAEFLKKHPHLVVEVGVHSDTRGSDKLSTRLTQRRAMAIGEILVEQFQIPLHQLRLQGYEGSDPIIPHARIQPFYEFEKQEYELRHQVNRRVELKVVKVDKD
jgi:outer membrane protein OmpA-like peptidoglycan-associated protein